MNSIYDRLGALQSGFAAIREQYKLPAGFPTAAEAEAEAATACVPTDHADRTDMPFVTLDLGQEVMFELVEDIPARRFIQFALVQPRMG